MESRLKIKDDGGKMKKMTHTLCLALLAAGLALAQPGPASSAKPETTAPDMMAPEAPMMPGMAGVVGIAGMMPPDMTEEQVQKCDAMRIAHLKTVMPIQTDIQVAEIELDALWRTDEPDVKKIIAKVKELSDLRAKLELARVSHRLDMHKVFTPEQRKAMKKMHMGKGMKGGRGRGMGMGMRGKQGMRQAGPGGQCDMRDCQDCQMR
jgi:Spy/CpxP family protein refolding chaperone